MDCAPHCPKFCVAGHGKTLNSVITMFKIWKNPNDNSFSWYIYTSLQDVRIFQYYKELIGFRGVGDPHLLMKFIDPREVRTVFTD